MLYNLVKKKTYTQQGVESIKSIIFPPLHLHSHYYINPHSKYRVLKFRNNQRSRHLNQ